MPIERMTIGVILAGGRSTRMGGGDKCLRLLGGRPLLAHVIARAAPQVGRLLLNANGDPARFAAFGLDIVPDSLAGHPGPLAGVLAGLDWARRQAPEARAVVTFPSDSPFLPRDLVARLTASGAPLARARSAGRAHPVAALWPVALADDLRRALAEGLRKIDLWTARHGAADVEWDAGPPDPIYNANAPDLLVEAERLLAHAD
jgi:molybdopterin-guanine dinucleotide biosynthesis protein A